MHVHNGREIQAKILIRKSLRKRSDGRQQLVYSNTKIYFVEVY